MRTLIVDDSRLARAELRTLLAAHPDVQLVGEADDVPQAIEAVTALNCELLLLDVQLPSGTGFDVLQALEQVPQVVFTTAYDHYAVRAFEANVLDYLVKPIVPARLAQALERARLERLERSARSPHAAQPLQPAERLLRGSDQVFVRDGERCWFVALHEISHIVVDGNYAAVWFRGSRALLARTLTALEHRLDPALFFRANRNALVNLRAVRSIDPWVNDGYRITLTDGSAIDVSRRQARELRERLAL